MILSIIVPIYNASKYIHRCIDSLLAQGLKEGEYENYVRYCLEKLTEQSKTKWRMKNENHRNSN